MNLQDNAKRLPDRNDRQALLTCAGLVLFHLAQGRKNSAVHVGKRPADGPLPHMTGHFGACCAENTAFCALDGPCSDVGNG